VAKIVSIGQLPPGT
jgi:hypothetical protein